VRVLSRTGWVEISDEAREAVIRGKTAGELGPEPLVPTVFAPHASGLTS